MSLKRRTIKGRAASRGAATGQPKIVRETADLSTVKLGDVLVAIETDVSYVPAMQRASAIVTETGGRFCHAAVWARENKKPTVLQAENATELLDNVPEVTVSADAGSIEWDESV